MCKNTNIGFSGDCCYHIQNYEGKKGLMINGLILDYQGGGCSLNCGICMCYSLGGLDRNSRNFSIVCWCCFYKKTIRDKKRYIEELPIPPEKQQMV